MAQLKVKPSKLSGEVTAPPSKSYTHRAFMIAALARGESKITNPLLGFDTEATIEAARALGAEIAREGNVWRVRGTGGRLKPRVDLIDARNSGTTIRMMSAIAALSPKPVHLTGDESILKRPMGPLVEALEKLGAKARCEGANGRPPVVVGGGLRGGEVEITGAVSSQFISALLLAAPYALEDVKLTITEELRSKPYVEITLELLDSAGVKIRRNRSLTEFKIPGGQVFKPLELTVPGDFSSAAFVLGAAALTGSTVRVNNLDVRGAQGDRRIVDLLDEFGAEVRVKGKTVEVSGNGELSGIEADCGNNPDLVPVLAVLGSVADGRTRLTNIPHLRFKETDRLRALATELRKLGAEVEELPDELRLEGVGQLRGARLSSYGDHRMAMAFAVAGLAARGKTIVDGAESIPVSYPGFVKDMRKLGAKMELVE
ncbi:MAG: 3-phosphoshikimate 1-carboxyvinyltransferase [Candidatus Hodarchaeaceae archaeon]|nr:3-phosphoshikimate 1-carboxyvinyltransferase [Candidatus Hodarchaeaceae archaeon]